MSDQDDIVMILAAHMLESGKPTLPSRLDLFFGRLLVRPINRVWKITGRVPQWQAKVTGVVGPLMVGIGQCLPSVWPLWVRPLVLLVFILLAVTKYVDAMKTETIADHVLDNRITLTDARLLERARRSRINDTFVFLVVLLVSLPSLGGGADWVLSWTSTVGWGLIMYSGFARVTFAKPGTRISARVKATARKIKNSVPQLLPSPAPSPA